MIITETSRIPIVRGIRRRWPADEKLRLIFTGTVIEVRVSRSALAEGLSEYFKDYLTTAGTPEIIISVHEAPMIDFAEPLLPYPREAGKTGIKEEYRELEDGRVVKKRRTGLVFVFGENDNLAAGPCLANLNQVINFINNRFIEKILCRGGLLAHAAGVVIDGCGVAVAGVAGAGKSTLAVDLMSRGAVFFNNDRLILCNNSKRLLMRGVAKAPRINPGTALNNPHLEGLMSPAEKARFSALSKEDLRALEYKYDAPIETCFGPGRSALEGPLHKLFILHWKDDADQTILREVDLPARPDLLAAFIKETGLFFRPYNDCRMPAPVPENYLAFLSLCRCFEITGKIDFPEAANQVIQQLVEES